MFLEVIMFIQILNFARKTATKFKKKKMISEKGKLLTCFAPPAPAAEEFLSPNRFFIYPFVDLSNFIFQHIKKKHF